MKIKYRRISLFVAGVLLACALYSVINAHYIIAIIDLAICGALLLPELMRRSGDINLDGQGEITCPSAVTGEPAKY